MSSTGNKAFTLVEMMVVIVMIAVLATLIAPQFAGHAGSAQLREAARQLLMAARYAHQHAVTHRQTCRLIIDTDQQRFSLVVDNNSAQTRSADASQPTRVGPIMPMTLPSTVAFGLIRIQPRGPRFQSPTQFITFEPTGEADSAIVQLTNGRKTYSLLVAPSSGKATLTEQPVSQLPNDREDLDA